MRNRNLKKMRRVASRKPRNILFCSILSFIFIMSLMFSSGISLKANVSQLQSKDLTTQSWQTPITTDIGSFEIDWDNDWVTQSEVEDFGDILEFVYYRLATTWNLPDPMDGGKEPPIEVTIVQEDGKNGKAGTVSGDEEFYLKFWPEFLDPSLEWSLEPTLVAGHEVQHLTQYVHPGTAPKKWVLEGQSRMGQDKMTDTLDHADGTEVASYLEELNDYLYWNHDDDLTSLEYTACLFWNYLCEQFGTDKTDPDYGIDFITTFWDTNVNPTSEDGITMTNNALNALSPGTSFEEVFADFCIANFAKDLTDSTVPAHWEYVDDDEADSSSNYRSVKLDLSDNLGVGGWKVGLNHNLERYSSKYFVLGLDPAVKAFVVKINQTTLNSLSYALLATRGDDLVYSYTSDGPDFQRALVNDNYDEFIVVIIGLGNYWSNDANFNYAINAANPEVAIDSPTTNFRARAGPHDNPEKFVAIVDVSESTVPIHGFTTDNFRATVGVQPATVLAAVDVYGKYFLEIQAPNQITDLAYRLRIELVDNDGTPIATANSLSSVKYGEHYIDSVIVLDSSGSMGTNNKLAAAQSAAKMYVNSYLSQDQMGVVDYDTTAAVVHQLQELTSGNRTNAISAIDAVTAGGLTAIGDGLLEGQNELFLRGIENYSKEIILLSDGKETELPSIAQVKPHLLNNYTTVHSITIGSDAAYTTMQELAGDTGGSYHFCFDPSSGDISNDLAEIYRAVVGTVRNLQRFYQDRGEITGSQNIYVDVKDDADMIEILVHYNSTATPTITLQRPNGTSVSVTQSDDDAGMGHNLYRIDSPEIGLWNVTINPSASLKYFVEGAQHGMLTMRVMAPPIGSVSQKWGNAVHIGDQIPIIVTLSDSQPIINADVWMETTPPGFKTNGTKFLIPLHDDGGHGDGAPNDGIYGNYYTPTSENGSYSFLINATGMSNDYGSFTRLKTGAFHVFKDQEPLTYDGDLDGLPDKWERRYSLNASLSTGEHGSLGDPDRDGLLNPIELFYGTDPLNSDTDGGGEADGSETMKSLQPLHPRDDNITAFPNVREYPGNRTATFIITNSTSTYDTLMVYRSPTSIFDFGAPIYNGAYNKTFTDVNLTNYNTYYYRFVAESAAQGRTGMSRSYEIIPKENVLTPEIYFGINNGSKLTTQTNVTLQIYQVENDHYNISAFNATHMRITNNHSAVELEPWIPIQSQISWNLTTDASWPKFVWAQVRDNQTIPEVSAIMSAGINYGVPNGGGDGVPPIGSESVITVFFILIDFIVVFVIYYKKRQPKLSLTRFNS